MNCSDLQYLMPLQLSGELDSASMAQLERHVNECPACQEQIEEQQDLNKGIRAALLSESVDTTALRMRVLNEVKGKGTVSIINTARHPIRIALAVAAGLLIVLAVGAANRDNARYEQASLDHVDEVVRAGHREWRTQGNSIGQLISQCMKTPPQLEQLSIPGYQLLRGKECGISRSRYIHLVYSNGAQQISMYVLEDDEHGSFRSIFTSLLPLVRSRTEAGYNVTEGDAAGRRVLVVSALPQSEEQVIVKHVLHAMG
jgi:anti-sigma factor RsiW